ncbi:MAG: hypothetical protein A2V66_05555 [Ignavibacteria bacterium RBG_13_36_8]|nr:MAG: hypothetical protein A2V66_05555 [Ignavibacteria bacterium RBG_13_36_8]
MDPVLNVFLFFSIIFIISIEFYLNNINEIFYGGHILGEVVVNLSLAFIVTYIFYFIVVHIKIQKDKEIIHKHVHIKIGIIISDTKIIIKEMAKISHYQLTSEYPNKNELFEICSNIKLDSNGPMVIGKNNIKANWAQYLDFMKRRTEKHIQDIFIFMQYLDTYLVSSLYSIQDSFYLKYIGFISSGMISSNTILSGIHDQLKDFFDDVNKLEVYSNKIRK